MANQKITQLIVADTPADTDLVELVQNVAAEPRSRKATIAQLRTGVLNSPSPAFGMLVLASPDSQRFESAMGTDFLERIAELAGAALSRLRV